MRNCRLCHERPVCPSRLLENDYRCSRCRNASPAIKAANARWRKTPDGRACSARTNAKRIFIGDNYHSSAATAELAAVVNAHIKERLRAFSRLKTGA